MSAIPFIFQTYISLSRNQIGGFKPESGGFQPSF
jgi:hypothetical protein